LRQARLTTRTSNDNMRTALEYLYEKSLVFRAYGHLFVGDYKEGYADLEEAKQISSLD